MIRVECHQGSAAWYAARIGIPTASQFSRILTQKTMRLSASAATYRNELVAEWLLGEALDDGSSTFMERGTALEQEAVDFYELRHDSDVERVGFLLRDDRRCGCSPDGLVGARGGLEIKCPSAAVHVGYLLDAAGEQYKAQIQGGLWIAERDWWDFLSFNPALPPALVRFERDDSFIGYLAAAVEEFCDQLDEAKARLTALGYGPPLAEEPEPFFSGVG